MSSRAQRCSTRRDAGPATAPSAVEFRPGDISRLEFGDATFDGVTCERVFQHLDTPDTAIGELVRVTKPGGRLVVIDTDWGMHAIHGADPDVTARIIACWSTVPPTAGPAASSRRCSPSPAFPIPWWSPRRSRHRSAATDGAPFTTMAAAAANAGAITRADAVSWLAELADAGASGAFFWAVTMFAVGGVRHSPN